MYNTVPICRIGLSLSLVAPGRSGIAHLLYERAQPESTARPNDAGCQFDHPLFRRRLLKSARRSGLLEALLLPLQMASLRLILGQFNGRSVRRYCLTASVQSGQEIGAHGVVEVMFGEINLVHQLERSLWPMNLSEGHGSMECGDGAWRHQ